MTSPRPPEGRPFVDGRWTLGMLSGLAHYIYTDAPTEAARAQALAVLSEMQARRRDEAAGTMANDSIFILQAAIDKGRAEQQKYAADKAEKDRFLARHLLEEDVPPGVQGLLEEARSKPLLAGLRAEIYRKRDTGEHTLVFRGSAQWEDWINNIWMGLDLGRIEAPYYQHAKSIVQKFLGERPGAKLVVVGHSLGGGLAQHVGKAYNLRVVAFNSSPLPETYIGGVSEDQQARTRVYTAVYVHPTTGIITPDPLSIDVSRSAYFGWLKRLSAKSTHHLVVPTCTLAKPNPFVLPEEDRRFVEAAHAALSTPSIFSRLGLLQHTAGRFTHWAWAEALSRDPMWQAAHDKHGLQVRLVGERLLKAGAGKYFAYASGLLSGGQLASDAIRGKAGGVVVNLALKTALFASQLHLQNLLLAHSMDRYHRGLQRLSGQDSFEDSSLPAEQEVLDQCGTLWWLH